MIDGVLLVIGKKWSSLFYLLSLLKGRTLSLSFSLICLYIVCVHFFKKCNILLLILPTRKLKLSILLRRLLKKPQILIQSSLQLHKLLNYSFFL